MEFEEQNKLLIDALEKVVVAWSGLYRMGMIDAMANATKVLEEVKGKDAGSKLP